MARAQDDPAAARRAFLATGVSVWLCWNAGTLVGALLGGGLGDPRTLGLDAMFPAAFLALLARSCAGPARRSRRWPARWSPSGCCRSRRPACR